MSEQVVEGQAPAVDAPLVVVEEPEAPVQAALVDEETALDEALEAQAIEVPDGDKLVPLSAVTNLRQKLKAAKAGTEEAAALKQQLEQAQQQLQATAPLAEAFRALQQAQQHQQQAPQPQQPQGPTAEEVSELEEIARDFDFYKVDGTLDVDKAKRVQARESKRAQSIAQAQVQPLVTNTLQQRAVHNLQRAKATTHPVTKQGVDPQILDALAQKIAEQPNGLQTLADPDSMKQLWLNAYALSTFQAQAPAAQTPQPVAQVVAPLLTEAAGGQVTGAAKPLSDMEKRAAKEAGLTEKAYQDMAKGMRW